MEKLFPIPIFLQWQIDYESIPSWLAYFLLIRHYIDLEGLHTPDKGHHILLLLLFKRQF